MAVQACPFLQLTDGTDTVTFAKEDGKSVKVPLAKLSPADQTLITAFAVENSKRLIVKAAPEFLEAPLGTTSAEFEANAKAAAKKFREAVAKKSIGEALDDFVVSDDPTAWHPDDALFAPIEGPGGRRYGVISVDDPADGARPSDAQLEEIALRRFEVGHHLLVDRAILRDRPVEADQIGLCSLQVEKEAVPRRGADAARLRSERIT